jgi:tRNA pseudouridine13 synthase
VDPLPQSAVAGVQLLPGATHFYVEELPAYAPSGSGAHWFVEVEKRDLNTDAIASALARVCDVPVSTIGFAGRKDRHAIARQWFSVPDADDARLAELAVVTRDAARVLQVSRHAHKLQLGHLRGNRFRLELAAPDAPAAALELRARLEVLERDGMPNRFGPQRFGIGGSTLETARALGRGEPEQALRWVVDPSGAWQLGDPLPSGPRRGAQGRVLASLERRPHDAGSAWHAAGRPFRGFLASAAQAAIFNAVLEGRREAGLLHRLREGDLACGPRGRVFRCLAERIEELDRLAAPGSLEMFTTGPLPGKGRPSPSDAVVAEERAWSGATGIPWEWFEARGALRSRGARRPLLLRFLEPARIEPSSADRLRLEVALPAGSYATELLSELGIALPATRADTARVTSSSASSSASA